jgi:hypothetical protein
MWQYVSEGGPTPLFGWLVVYMRKHREKTYLEILMDLDVFRLPEFRNGFWNAVCVCVYVRMNVHLADA